MARPAHDERHVVAGEFLHRVDEVRDALLVGVAADEKQHLPVDAEFRLEVATRRLALAKSRCR